MTPGLRGAHGLHAFFGQEESPCSTLSRCMHRDLGLADALGVGK